MQYWLDGFNIFYIWENTRNLFLGRQEDIANIQQKALKILAKNIGKQNKHTVVFLDGGMRKEQAQKAGLKIEYAGPRNTADQLMLDKLQIVNKPQRKNILAVTNDRQLRDELNYLGANCLRADEYLALLDKKNNQPTYYNKKKKKKTLHKIDNDSKQVIIQEKYKTLSSHEVEAWLEYFNNEENNNIK